MHDSLQKARDKGHCTKLQSVCLREAAWTWQALLLRYLNCLLRNHMSLSNAFNLQSPAVRLYKVLDMCGESVAIMQRHHA